MGDGCSIEHGRLDTRRDADQLSEPYLATGCIKGEVATVPATELEIAAAIVVLQKRSMHFPVPIEVQAYPFDPAYGWRQAALRWIKENHEATAAGRGTVI